MCEVFAYIVSIMMLMSRDMCSVAHPLCSVRNLMCEVFDGITLTHNVMLMSCNTFSAHVTLHSGMEGSSTLYPFVSFFHIEVGAWCGYYLIHQWQLQE